MGIEVNRCLFRILYFDLSLIRMLSDKVFWICLFGLYPFRKNVYAYYV